MNFNVTFDINLGVGQLLNFPNRLINYSTPRSSQMDEKAEYQISSSVNDGIVEIVMTGELVNSAHDKMSNEVIAITKDVNYVLVDIRALKGRLGFTETYERVRNCPPHMYNTHIAMVDILENADYESFNETTSSNAGLNLKWFTDIDAARDWLKSKQKKG